jgi:hypothetical protein
MADLTLGNNFNVVDKRAGRGNTTGTSIIAETANLDTVADMKTRLAAINGTSYTADRMNKMTVNDLVYALRVASADAAGI